MTSPDSFWDKAAPKYAKSPISDIDGYRATLERTISHLKPTDRVLEIGCGTASTAMDIAPHVTHLIATDLSPVMIDIAREKLWDASLRNVDLRVAPADQAAQATDAPFDAILALNLLHLVPDQEAVLAHIHGALKPGGLFISKTACLGERWFFKPLVGLMRLIGKAPYVTHQRTDELRRAIVAQGFSVVEELTQTGAAPRLYLVARKV